MSWNAINGIALASISAVSGVAIANVSHVNGIAKSAGSNALLTSLIEYWKLDEASGNALGAHNSITLTDTNTVGAGTGLVYGNARDFESTSTEYFTVADSASLSTGDIDFTFAYWVKFESLSANQDMVSKDTGSAPNREFLTGYGVTANRLRFIVFDAASGATPVTVTANNFGAPSTGAWLFVVVDHDATANAISIQVNNGTADTASTSAGVRDGTAPFRIGNRGDSGSPADGLIGPVMFWKRIITAGERTDLYNAGAGRAYSYFA